MSSCRRILVIDFDILRCNSVVAAACTRLSAMAFQRVVVCSVRTREAEMRDHPHVQSLVADLSRDVPVDCRCASDDCSREADDPVEWILESMCRMIEEASGTCRTAWLKSSDIKSSVVCIAATDQWRRALTRLCSIPASQIRACVFTSRHPVAAADVDRPRALAIATAVATRVPAALRRIVLTPRKPVCAMQMPF
jgi:hypothetical protein